MATTLKHRTATVLKNAGNFCKKAFRSILMILSVIVALSATLVLFLLLPTIYMVSAKTAAKLIYKKPWDNKFVNGIMALMPLCGLIFWDKFILSGACPKRKRIAFIDAQQKYEYELQELDDLPVKYQVEYWLAKRNLGILKQLSWDAVTQLFEQVSVAEKADFIKAFGLRPEFIKSLIIGSYDELNLIYTVGNDLNRRNQLDSILPDCIKAIQMLNWNEQLNAWLNLGNFVKAFGFDKFKYLDKETTNVLWISGDENLRLLVLLSDGFNIPRLSNLLHSGLYDLLRKALYHRTLSTEHLEWLLEQQKDVKKIDNILIEYISSNGLHMSSLQKVYKSNHPLKDKLQRAVDIYEENCLIKGFSDCTPEKNLDYWKTYILQNKSVLPESQRKMQMEHFLIFSEAGLRLDSDTLEYLLVNVRLRNYISLLLEKEWDSITPHLVSLLKATPWKYTLYMNEKEKRTEK